MKNNLCIHLITLFLVMPASNLLAHDKNASDDKQDTQDEAKQKALQSVDGHSFVNEAALQKSWWKGAKMGKDGVKKYRSSNILHSGLDLLSEGAMAMGSVPVAGVIGAKQGWDAAKTYNKHSSDRKVGKLGAALRGGTALMAGMVVDQGKNLGALKKAVFNKFKRKSSTSSKPDKTTPPKKPSGYTTPPSGYDNQPYPAHQGHSPYKDAPASSATATAAIENNSEANPSAATS